MTRLLWKGRRPIGTMTIMAQTSSVYATLIAGLAPPEFQKDKSRAPAFGRF